MQLRSMSAHQYRSLRSIRMDLSGVNLFIGENGVGKSNLYRALQLVQAAVRGRLAHEISSEGGMFSACGRASGVNTRRRAYASMSN